MIEGQAVVPADPGSESQVARALLALLGPGDSVHDVVYLPGQAAFLVPDELAEKYRESLAPVRPRRNKKEISNG